MCRARRKRATSFWGNEFCRAQVTTKADDEMTRNILERRGLRVIRATFKPYRHFAANPPCNAWFW